MLRVLLGQERTQELLQVHGTGVRGGRCSLKLRHFNSLIWMARAPLMDTSSPVHLHYSAMASLRRKRICCSPSMTSMATSTWVMKRSSFSWLTVSQLSTAWKGIKRQCGLTRFKRKQETCFSALTRTQTRSYPRLNLWASLPKIKSVSLYSSSSIL